MRIDPGRIHDLLDVDCSRSVRWLLGQGWLWVSVNTKTIQVVRALTLDGVSLATLKPAFWALSRLAQSAARVSPGLPMSRPATPLEVMGIPAIAVVVLSWGGLIWQLCDSYLSGTCPVLGSALLGSWMAVALSAVVVLKLRGPSTAAGDLVACSGLLLLAGPLFMAALLPFLNRLLDHSPPHRYPSVVLGKRPVPKQRDILTLQGIGGASSSIEASDCFTRHPFAREPGTSVTLVVRDGFFGWRYLEDIE